MTGSDPVLSAQEFRHFQRFIFEAAGITMSDAKQALVSGRLIKRVKLLGFKRYQEYFDYISATSGQTEGLQERQVAIDLLTTNETYFFREPRHFDFLTEQLLPHWKSGPRRVWSAACSSGEEACTIAMVLSEHSPTDQWEVIGTDISTRVVEQARRAQYPMPRARNMPQHYLKKYCLRGVGSKTGTFLVKREIRERTRFQHANLNDNQGSLGKFDVIFLRNVMIYFNIDTKRVIVANVCRQLKPGGILITGHSESLHGVTSSLELLQPSVYRKRG